jgi:1-acyl-sn-glycerol-3-phosphate acyltransferase
MTAFSIDLFFASRAFGPGPGLMTVTSFWEAAGAARVALDLVFVSFFAGIFSVPLYALIQARSDAPQRARIFAASNILGALFMIASAGLSAFALGRGVPVEGLFATLGIMNLAVTVYVFLLVPEFFLRFVAWILANLIYQFRIRGEDNIPESGPAVLACNHVSFVDAMLILAACPRPVTFIMDHRLFRMPVLGWIFRIAKAVPVASQKEDPLVYARAFDEADRTLASGDLLGIFPEGAITRDGEVQAFKGGIMKILERRPAPVVPMALQNLWGSFFSRVEGAAMTRPFRRGFFSPVRLVIGRPIGADAVTPSGLRETVIELRGAFLR